MNLVASTLKETVLTSLLDQAAFAKIQSVINLNEAGVVAQCQTKDFSSKMNFSFCEWKFSGTQVESKSGQVLFCGGGFGGRTLLAIIQSGPVEQRSRAVFAYSAAVKQAVAEGVFLPANGAGGILYFEDEKTVSLLFLPQNLFEAAAHNASLADYAEVQGVWQDKNLLQKNDASLCWTRAAVVYQTLSKRLPFPAQDLEERQADILDKNYLPLECVVNGVSKRLSDMVSYALEFGSADFEAKMRQSGFSAGGKVERADRDFCLDDLACELGLSPNGSVTGVERKPAMDKKEFEGLSKRLLRKKAFSAKKSRVLRRHRAFFVAGAMLFLAGFFLSRTMHGDKMRRPTTVSLTPREVCEVFFSGMHRMDTQAMQFSSSGKQARAMVDSVANLYVSSKMRDAFTQTIGTLTPEFWLYRADQHDKWIFGITNFMVGKSNEGLSFANNRKTAPTLRQKPVALKESNGAKESLFVQYYRVHSEGMETSITVDKFFGTVELTFVKNRWLLTSYDLPFSQEVFSAKDFESDYKAALEECGGDALLACRNLSQKYQWIPSEREMVAARTEDEINKKEAEKR